MKKYVVAALAGSLCFSILGFARAHDGGHGPMVTDQGNQGGVVSSVIDKKDIKKGAKAAVLYKAELVRAEDGIVRVYLYDIEMNELDLSAFEKTAKGNIEVEVKKKFINTPFELNLTDGVFTGSAPKATKKPFNIDVYFKSGELELFAAFENLD
jgi:hypothetical protein